MPEVDLGFPRSWLEFTDPDNSDRIFRCDTTWLVSNWTCIFGRGCPGIYEDSPSVGCCTLGAHYTDKADRKNTEAWANKLSADEWQFHDIGHSLGVSMKNDDGERQTRVVAGACILLNRDGFAGGAGCALHLYAVNNGLDYQDVKPEVCWQLPVRREYDTRSWPDESEVEVVVITEFDRRGWGPGGHDLDWYCSGATEAHIGTEPVYRSERATLERLMGKAAYAELVRLIELVPGHVPHPADPVGKP